VSVTTLRYLAWLGFVSAILALILLALAPLGWRMGLWHFRTSFYRLMSSSAFLAAAAAVVSLAALVLGWSAIEAGDLALAGIGLVLGLVLAYVPWQYKRTLDTVPRIHDITTDTANPPPFVAVMAARSAEAASPAAYEGAELARQQQAAYPDLAPIESGLAPGVAFDRALAAAEAMHGWRIVAKDTAAGRIEASETSRWFGFTDDIVIRVAAAGNGSRIDMRSLSRQGRSDFGVNAARIRSYMAAVKASLKS